MPSHNKTHEIYLEILDVGRAYKVSAVCSQTLEEISFTAPKATPRSQIEQLAKQKLTYVINKKLRS